ncbi:unnamed protein product [Fructobacillus tropaeoli]|uniref:hypothetical protein n=1 Tax=Fructobacillus tropaeoli TaxID=709323 RepID=UPI002DB49475|nr:unnamed protein product [Fructobacillus tropaeoli]
MQSFLAIKSDLRKKQRHSKKWRFALYIPLICGSIWLIHSIYLVNSLQLNDVINPNLFLIVDLLLIAILMEDAFFFFIFRFFHRIDRITKTENEIIDIATKTQVDEWLSQNKKLIANSILSSTLFIKKNSYYSWGVINQDDYYQIVFIDLSKKNTLVILTIQKSEVHQYDEENTIENLIDTIQKKARELQKPIRKQFYTSSRFF